MQRIATLHFQLKLFCLVLGFSTHSPSIKKDASQFCPRVGCLLTLMQAWLLEREVELAIVGEKWATDINQDWTGHYVWNIRLGDHCRSHSPDNCQFPVSFCALFYGATRPQGSWYTLSIPAYHPPANHGKIQLLVKLQFQQLHGKSPATLIEESKGREYFVLQVLNKCLLFPLSFSFFDCTGSLLQWLGFSCWGEELSCPLCVGS